jgi:hypothetical protein
VTSEGKKRSDIGGSTASIVQPVPLYTAAAAAAEAARARLVRQKQQQEMVLPDEVGLPTWAREKLKQRQAALQIQKTRTEEEERRKGDK